MNDSDFRALCNTYGFAPSRALRELIDCAIGQAFIVRNSIAYIKELELQRAALLEALRLIQIECQHLHHAKKDQHALEQPCPVVARISAAIAKVEGQR